MAPDAARGRRCLSRKEEEHAQDYTRRRRMEGTVTTPPAHRKKTSCRSAGQPELDQPAGSSSLCTRSRREVGTRMAVVIVIVAVIVAAAFASLLMVPLRHEDAVVAGYSWVRNVTIGVGH